MPICESILLIILIGQVRSTHITTTTSTSTSTTSSTPSTEPWNKWQPDRTDESNSDFYYKPYDDNMGPTDRQCRNDLTYEYGYRECNWNGGCCKIFGVMTGCCDDGKHCCQNRNQPEQCCHNHEFCCGNLEDSQCCLGDQSCEIDWSTGGLRYVCTGGINPHLVWISLPIYWGLLLITVACVGCGKNRSD